MARCSESGARPGRDRPQAFAARAADSGRRGPQWSAVVRDRRSPTTVWKPAPLLVGSAVVRSGPRFSGHIACIDGYTYMELQWCGSRTIADHRPAASSSVAADQFRAPLACGGRSGVLLARPRASDRSPEAEQRERVARHRLDHDSARRRPLTPFRLARQRVVGPSGKRGSGVIRTPSSR